ncbi:MAG: type II toxin-antitoxin system HicA family toxin [Sedimenticola sp.]
MNHKQQHTLETLFKEPVSGNMHWREIESLLKSLGVALQLGHGARIRLQLNYTEGSLHRPHHSGVLSKKEARHLRQFLISAGIDSP